MALPALPAAAANRDGRALQLARVFREESPLTVSDPWQPPPHWFGCYDGPPPLIIQVNRQCNHIAARGRIDVADGIVCGIVCGAEFDAALRTSTTTSTTGYAYFEENKKITVDDRFPACEAMLYIDRDDLTDEVLVRNMRHISYVPNPENKWMRVSQ